MIPCEHYVCYNPVGVVVHFISFTQGSFATLVWKTQSRWDCRNGTTSSFCIHPAAFS
jgi:hypothetical protein